MNVSRLVASVGSYFYSTGADTLAVHLYGGNSASLNIGGRRVSVTERSDYPWSGTIRVAIDPEEAVEFSVRLRIPGWAHGATARVNGKAIDVSANLAHGYLDIRRRWQKGDAIDLELPMPVERLYANPNVRMDVGRVALKRGPLVYCAEQVDNARPVPRLRLPRDAKVAAHPRRDLFDGIVTLVADGEAVSDDWRDDLYRSAPPAGARATVTALPYFLWNNREPGAMAIWIPEA